MGIVLPRSKPHSVAVLWNARKHMFPVPIETILLFLGNGNVYRQHQLSGQSKGGDSNISQFGDCCATIYTPQLPKRFFACHFVSWFPQNIEEYTTR